MSRVVLAVAAAACMASVAPAQDREQAPGRNVGFLRGSPLFRALDTDRDGSLSAAEIANAAPALAALDQNHDGQLTLDETRPNFSGRGVRRGAENREGSRGPGGNTADELVKSLMEFDKNGDGKLSKEELPERFQGMFDHGDANHDGFLSPEEIRNMAAAQNAGNRGRPGREGGGRERGHGVAEGATGMDPIFTALDTDHDGVISADEIASAALALKMLDKNHDGRLTEDEVRPNFWRGPGGVPRQR